MVILLLAELMDQLINDPTAAAKHASKAKLTEKAWGADSQILDDAGDHKVARLKKSSIRFQPQQYVTQYTVRYQTANDRQL